MQRPHPGALKKLVIWNSLVSGVVAKINDKQKRDADRQSWANLLTVPHPPSPVQTGTGRVFEARVLYAEG